MIKADDAIRTARSLIGTPYSQLDCINLIKKVIRTSPGGVPGYTTAGTNTLWDSANASAKYRDLTWRQESIKGARAGMLSFKRSGTDVHHIGLVTGDGTAIHSSSVAGKVVETALDKSWQLLAIHRYIDVDELPKTAAPTAPSGGSLGDGKEKEQMTPYKMQVVASSLNVRNEPGIGGTRIGRLSEGAVVTVQAEMENGWKFITYGDSGSGYVDGSYLGAYEEPAAAENPKITIVDSQGNHFCPVGDWKVLIGSID
ncbi:MAG: SH3 domain-containing protein [Candidatus Ventricola sp.]